MFAHHCLIEFTCQSYMELENTPTPSGPLLPPSYMFKVSLPLYYRATEWKPGSEFQLEPRYEVPTFESLDQPEEAFCSTRIAWSEEGLWLQFSVQGKKLKPLCRLTDLEQSDGVELFVDTRNTKNVHRATRFCHRFLFLPKGGGTEEKDPYGSMLKIRLARGEPSSIGQFQPHVYSKIRRNGYDMSIHLSRKDLEGWAPTEQPEMGLYFVVRDQELGLCPMIYDLNLPVYEDPSLWPTAFLTPNQGK